MLGDSMFKKLNHPALRILLVVPTFAGACIFAIGFILARTSLTFDEAIERGMDFIIPFFFVLIMLIPAVIYLGIALLIAVILKHRGVEMHWWEFMTLPEDQRRKLLGTPSRE